MTMPSKEILDKLREQYPDGARVKLVKMDDPYVKMDPGTMGTVRLVDDTGTIHVNGDNGHGLGVVYGEDSCKRVLTAKELCEEDEVVYKFAFTSSYAEYELIAPADTPKDRLDISGCLENTLYRIIEHDGDTEDVQYILGAIIPDAEDWEQLEEFGEYTSLDLGYVIPGLLTGIWKEDEKHD